MLPLSLPLLLLLPSEIMLSLLRAVVIALLRDALHAVCDPALPARPPPPLTKAAAAAVVVGTSLRIPRWVAATVMVLGVGQRRRRERRGKMRQGYFLKPLKEMVPMLSSVVVRVS